MMRSIKSFHCSWLKMYGRRKKIISESQRAKGQKNKERYEGGFGR